MVTSFHLWGVYLVMFVTHDCHIIIPCIIFLGDAVVVDPHTIYTANGNLVEPGIYNLLLTFGRVLYMYEMFANLMQDGIDIDLHQFVVVVVVVVVVVDDDDDSGIDQLKRG